MQKSLKVIVISAALLLGAQTIVQAQSSRRIQVLSAVIKDKSIPDAEIIVQKNGQQSVVGRTDANGQATIKTPFDDDESSTLIIKKNGYSTLVAKCACDGLTYALSPVMTNLDGMRIVLSWGEDPYDLDSHLSFGDQHVFFSQKQGDGASLDVDDTDSYGPETITIDAKKFGTEYIYRVHNYSDRQNPNSYRLGNSMATIYVYVGESLVKTYSVPRGVQGNLWTVFKINEVGDIQDINQMSGTRAERAQMDNQAVAAVSAEQIGAASDYAIALNKAGEQSYHSGNLQAAVDKYRMAIEEDSRFGQAYSNLGLAYKKQGKNAEAIWANRRAISYAYGSNAHVVRASSYYNIARIYEERGEYRNALNHYQLAKSNNANSVYDNAINRVKAKIR